MEPTKPTKESTLSSLLTMLIVVTGSVCFCSKGVFAKLSYGHGLDALAVLHLRMILSAPFFAGIVIWHSKGIPVLPMKEWIRFAALGFFGYYLSSLVNFSGLQYISVGLERVVLYSYPTLVLLLSVVFLRLRIAKSIWVAAFLAWLGIAVSFLGEIEISGQSGETVRGMLLVFMSAVTYAGFILLSGSTIKRYGPLLFSGLSGFLSCVFMILHFALTHGYSTFAHYPTPVYGYGIILSVFGTVVPIFLMGIGLQRAGPQRFAVLGAIGPVATVVLAAILLDERASSLQVVGLVLTILGGLGVTLLQSTKFNIDSLFVFSSWMRRRIR